MDRKLIVICICFICYFAKCTSYQKDDPDYYLSAEQYILSRNFKPQSHQVLTADGVELTVHRLINEHHSSPMKDRPVVLLMHPLLGSSVDFMYNAPGGSADEAISEKVGNNLAFELGKRGFDVWLGNVRGNVYSSHDFDSKRWDFSLDEIINYDLPSTIDYIMNKRNVSSINYIGHSQGAMIMFAHLSNDARANSLIDKFIALGPAVYLKEAAAPVRLLLQSPPVKTYLNFCDKFLYDPGTIKSFVKTVCPLLHGTCENIVYSLVGFDANQMNRTRFPVYISHVPAGTSCKNLKHYTQLLHKDGLEMYDYGAWRNQRRYGTRHPPAYDISKITLNNSISILFGANDFLTSPANVDKIRRNLKVQLNDYYLVNDAHWNHLDFIWGKDSGKLVNQRIIDILNGKARSNFQ